MGRDDEWRTNNGEWSANYFAKGWLLDRPEEAGGALMEFLPHGLSPTELKDLEECVARADAMPMETLLVLAREHVVLTRTAHKSNPLLDLGLAEALLGRIETVAKDWESVPPFARSWCKGMMLYFATPNDDVHDHASPIGFDDDAEVINACLRVAGRDDLCINPEDC